MSDRFPLMAVVPEHVADLLSDEGPLPPEVRENLLDARGEAEHDVFRSLKPLFVALSLVDLAKGPGEDGSIEAYYLVQRIRDYFRGRDAKVLPIPSREEFAAAFGDDGAVVDAIWPVVAFLEVTESLLESDQDANERLVKCSRVWEEARILLLLLNPPRSPESNWFEHVRSLLRETARTRRMSVDELVQDAFIFLRENAEKFLAYVPSGEPRDGVAYVAQSLRRVLGDTFVEKHSLLAQDEAGRIESSEGWGESASVTRLGLSPITKRRYRREGLVPGSASEDDYERVRLTNEARKHHHQAAGKTVSEVARMLQRRESTVRKALQEEIAASGQEPPKAQGRFYILSSEWIDRLKARLKGKAQRNVTEGVTCEQMAAERGLDVQQSRRALREEIKETGEAPPRVGRVYHLPPEWQLRVLHRLQRMGAGQP